MTFYFGAHMTSTKLMQSLMEVKDLGGNFIQIFINSPYTKFNPNLIKKYTALAPEIKQFCKENDMKIIIHSPYTLNFGIDSESDKDLWKLELIYDELTVAHLIDAIGCVIHVGKYLKTSEEEGATWMHYYISQMISYIRDNKLKSKIILETSAGQGTELFPSTDNSLAPIVDFYNQFSHIQKQHFKLCIDTCHIFVAGYDIRKRKQVRKLFSELKKYNVLKDIAVIHFNDSKKLLGSCSDRHEAIGYGEIGPSGLCEVLKLAKQNLIPCVLETPSKSYVDEIPWMLTCVDK